MRGARPLAELRGAGAAASFLSRLYLPGGRDPQAQDIARGAWAFPLVGAALGGLVGATAVVFSDLITPAAAAVLATALGLLLTGALHLDGLADAADGLGGDTPERALEIMRDHTVGVYGAAAISLDLLLRVTLVAALLKRGDAIGALVAAGAASRAAVLPVVLALPYAQPIPGSGAALSGMSAGRAGIGIAIAAALLFAAAGTAALAVLAVAVAIVIAAGRFFVRHLGGISGDALGATIELVELAALTTLVALA